MVPFVASKVPLLLMVPEILKVPNTFKVAPKAMVRLLTAAIVEAEITGELADAGIVIFEEEPGIAGHQLDASFQLLFTPSQVFPTLTFTVIVFVVKNVLAVATQVIV